MKIKKILSLFLAGIMVTGLIPVTVLADETTAVAAIGNTEYETLLEAVEAAEPGDEILLLNDVEISGDEEEAPWTIYEMPEDSTLNLDGYTLTIGYGYATFAGESFTICNGTFTVPSPTDYALFLGNKSVEDDFNESQPNIETNVIVKDITVIDSGINLLDSAKATLINCDVTVNPNRKYYAVYANANAELNIMSGTYTGGKKEIAVLKDSDATVTLYGGTYMNEIRISYLAACAYFVGEDGNELNYESDDDIVYPCRIEYKHKYDGWCSNEEEHWHECECGFVDDLGSHEESDWIVDVEATPDKDGYRYTECEICGCLLKKETIPATGLGDDDDEDDDCDWDYDWDCDWDWDWNWGIGAWTQMMFSRMKCYIQATSTRGGSISPAGITAVKYNKSQTYEIVPKEGYEIVSVYVDGKNMGAIEEYTFENVKHNHVISVVFARNCD